MKSKVTSFIMTILTIFMFTLLFFLAMVIYDEFIKEDIVGDVENFVASEKSKNVLIEDIKTPQIIEKESSVELVDSQEDTITITKTNTNNFYNQFYNQLDEYGKIIYNGLENNKENMKTGTYEINFGTAFSGLLSKENGEKILGDSYQCAIEAFTYDNPDVFYLDYSKLYLNIETTTRGFKKTYKVFLNSGDKGSYLNKEFPTKQSIDEALSTIESVRQYFINHKSASTYNNIKSVHEYLVESIEYEQTISKANIYNLYGALVEKSSVCEGYAKAFKYLMDGLDIPCVIVIGEGTNSEGQTESHAWNYVQLEGKWYAVDCTWDDPIIVGPGFLSNSSKYRYFLKGKEEFIKTHIPSGQFTENGKEFKYPDLSIDNYSLKVIYD